jgi:DNA-binding MarR family transcriptional regulator
MPPKSALREASEPSEDMPPRAPGIRNPRSDLIGLIYRLHGSLRSRFAGPNAGTGLVLLEALVLVVVMDAPEPPTVSDIGRQLGYSRQSVQRAVNKLVDLALLESLDNPRHKRAAIYVVTPEGRDRTLLVREPADRLADELEAEFGDARARALVRELVQLLRCINALP